MTTLVSTFLSHSSHDKSLVESVAEKLGKLGIVAWLDKNELNTGQDLTVALRKAIRDQATLSVFLSEKALKSYWVREELTIALAHYKESEKEELIKPIYLGDPYALIQDEISLKRWLNPEATEVAKLGVKFDPAAPMDENSQHIADGIAKSIYRSLHIENQRKVLINLDQRGSSRRGKPEKIPANYQNIEGAALVYRPRRGLGLDKETIIGEEWDQLVATMGDSLRTALNGVRWSDQKNIYISGNAQLGLAYFLGRHFNRSSGATLYCTDTRGTSFNNEGWDRFGPLGGGNLNCENNTDADLPPLPTSNFEEVVLAVGREYIIKNALPYLNATHPNTPIAWVRMPDRLNNSEEVKTLFADVTALAQRIKNENGCRTAYLLLGLPFSATPLFAAHMLYVLDRFVFLEYRGDVEGSVDIKESYAELTFPN